MLQPLDSFYLFPDIRDCARGRLKVSPAGEMIKGCPMQAAGSGGIRAMRPAVTGVR